MTGANRVENARRELDQARAVLAEARALAALAMWNGAVSRAYYAAFHAATAALFSLGLQARSHAGVRHLLLEHFIRPGVLDAELGTRLAELERYRHQADYRAQEPLDADTGVEQVRRAGEVIAAIEVMLRGRGVPA
jgi:uncharacterized protein (UPF0332 family)